MKKSTFLKVASRSILLEQLLCLLAMLAATSLKGTATPLASTFLYQGQLVDDGNPANGT
jgi:hypothetical protein